MIRVAISVEGPTEDEFCKRILAPFLRETGIEISPIIITTKRLKSGKKHKGGGVNLDRVKNELTRLLSSFDYVTTFYDLYGFDIKEILTADELESKIGVLFNNRKLIPYIQQYEFETLLFSHPEYYETLFSETSAKIKFEKIIRDCGGVEQINNSKENSSFQKDY